MSPAAHVVGRLRKLYGVVLGRMRPGGERREIPRRRASGPPPAAAFESLEPRLLLSVAPPSALLPGGAAQDPTGQELTVHSTIAGRHIFYNGSAWDGNDPLANDGDDGAIATDKMALLPGGKAKFANYTSYSRGINGIMVDIAGLANPAGLTLANIGDYFTFKVGNDSDPGWDPAPGPSGVLVRQGDGVGGSDRITILWADNAIQNTWLQVTVLSDAHGGHAGLAEDDVFCFGNAIAESGDSAGNAAEVLANWDDHSIISSPLPGDSGGYSL